MLKTQTKNLECLTADYIIKSMVSELTIQVEKSADEKLSVVTLKGSIDAKTIIQFQTKLNSVIEAGVNRLVIDMDRVVYVNSTGLGYLVNLADTLATKKGQVVLCNIQPKMKLVFDMLGLNTFFKIYTSKQEALKAVCVPTKATPSGATRKTDQYETVKVDHEPQEEPDRVECNICKALLVIHEKGIYRCPKCLSMFNFENNRISFLRRGDSNPVQLTLNFEEESIQGLMEFIKLWGRKAGLKANALSELQAESKDIIDIIKKHSYQDDDKNIYHVFMHITDEGLEIKFVDYGKTLEQKLLSKLSTEDYEVKVQAHPKMGNITQLLVKV